MDSGSTVYTIETCAHRDGYTAADVLGENFAEDTFWKKSYNSPSTLFTSFPGDDLLARWKAKLAVIRPFSLPPTLIFIPFPILPSTNNKTLFLKKYKKKLKTKNFFSPPKWGTEKKKPCRMTKTTTYHPSYTNPPTRGTISVNSFSTPASSNTGVEIHLRRNRSRSRRHQYDDQAQKIDRSCSYMFRD